MKDSTGILFSMSRHTGKAAHEEFKATAFKAYLERFGRDSDSVASTANLSSDDGRSENDSPIIQQTDMPDNKVTAGSDQVNVDAEDAESSSQTSSEHSKLLH